MAYLSSKHVLDQEEAVMAADKAPPETVERVNVALIPDSAEALEKLQSRTRLKKVDLVNQALKLYEFIDAETRAGNRVLIRDEDGKDYVVKLLY